MGAHPCLPRPNASALWPAVAAALTVLVLAGCDSGTGSAPQSSAPVTEQASVSRLEPAAFAAAVAEPDRVTINVHTPFEGQLDGTDLSVPYERIEDSASILPADRGTPLAVYCLTGRMSAAAVAELSAMGYTDVVELFGGMRAFGAAGLPVRR